MKVRPEELEFSCLSVFFVANKTRAARGSFSSQKETQKERNSWQDDE